MGSSILIVALTGLNVVAEPVNAHERDRINEMFEQLWGTDFVWELAKLPASGSVAEDRIPYSGAIYTHRAGGTMKALRKYDRAFSESGTPATNHERRDTSGKRRWVTQRGLFGFAVRRQVVSSPHWYGHCNGWTAAAIRHEEPQVAVERNGVTFTPSDIKGLLAEIYVYNHSECFVGANYRLNPAALHAFIGNWIGRGAHPVAMEADPGGEKWNYPIYSYETTTKRRSDREVEVKMTVHYSMYLKQEVDRSTHVKRKRYFHYALRLDEAGKITGGYFYRDSSSIDFLWIPMRPKQSGHVENKHGNPHVDVDQVLSIWRESVPSSQRDEWHVIDPADEDRLADGMPREHLIPIQANVTADPPLDASAAAGGTATISP